MKFKIFETCGTLGRCVGSYQKTFKRKSSDPPWKQVVVGGYPEIQVWISFDGRTYHNPIKIKLNRGFDRMDNYILNVAARSIRLRVKRSAEKVQYSLMCRE